MASYPSEIEQARLDRLWVHLLLVEEKTGKRLRKTPRGPLGGCPIFNFAPGRDKHGGRLFVLSMGGNVEYRSGESSHSYKIYHQRDTDWWLYLPWKEATIITRWVKEKIKERGNATSTSNKLS